jgi:hypothetical protein
MGHRAILTFDTSAINCLADDADSCALIAGLSSGFYVRLTFMSVSEIVATTCGERRRTLLGVCRRLVASGDCFGPHNEVLTNLIARFEEVPSFDWTAVAVRHQEAENEIVRQENFSEGLSEEEREEAGEQAERFEQLYADAKPHFDKLFATGTEKRPASVSELVDRLQVDGGAFWRMAEDLYRRVAKDRADAATIRRFVQECPPFHSLLIAIFAAQYDRCVRPPWVGPSLRAGRADILMSICLPYCDQFVTNDSRQRECFREVVSICGLNVTVRSYQEFRSGFFVMGATAGLAT